MSDSFQLPTSTEKKAYVQQMFGQIARTYDFFNHFLSLGLDFYWRRQAIKTLKSLLPNRRDPLIFDIACGTGDLSIEVRKQLPSARIIGVDLTPGMLTLFKQKINRRNLRGISVEQSDVEALQFPDQMADAAIIGFGTRNFTKLEVAFGEIYRVLKPGGIFINLELAKPRGFPIRHFYNFYFNTLLPATGTLLSRHNTAYRYLPASLRKFPDLEPLAQIMKEAGFHDVRWQTMTAGIVAIHIGIKSSTTASE